MEGLEGSSEENADREEHARAELGTPNVVGMKKPEVPSEEEVLAHLRRGHVPFANWCLDCMAGSGQKDPHFRFDPDQGATPLVQLDVGYLGLGEEGSGFLLTLVVFKDKRTSYLGGSVIEQKGDNQYARAAVDAFLTSWGT